MSGAVSDVHASVPSVFIVVTVIVCQFYTMATGCGDAKISSFLSSVDRQPSAVTSYIDDQAGKFYFYVSLQITTNLERISILGKQ